MSSIRERSPSEINLEKKLLNCIPPNRENTGPLFDFFKSKAKEMINYHLEKPKKPKKFSNENEDEIESFTPSKPVYKKKLQSRKVKEYVEAEPSDDFRRLREMINKRAYVVENVTSIITNQKKALNTIKITTNREHLIKQVSEVEESNESILQELETLLLSLHESLRQVDKLSQISTFERSNLKKDLNVEMQETLNKERKKFEAQIKALQDLNRSLSALPKATDVERDYSKRVAELQNKLEYSQSHYEEKSETLKKKNAEFTELLQELAAKNKEIEFLEKEQENLQDLIRSQEEGFERENAVLKSDIAKLEKLVKDNASSQEQALRNEIHLVTQSVQSKEREIAKLKLDINTLEEHLRRQNFEMDSKQRNVIELREEIQRHQDEKKAASKNESQEVNYLRQVLEEKERQLATERERVSIEIETREKHRIKQKNEWAEIYTGLKHEIKELKQTIIDLSEEKERKGLHSSIRESEYSESQMTLKTQLDTLKLKLKERDNEIKALWEIIAELQRTDLNKGKIDFNDVKTLIIIKNLEDKARSRLKKFLG